MNRSTPTTRMIEETSVDDVRRVRERLSREAGGDIHRQIEESNRACEPYIEKLGLKPVPLPGGGKKPRHRSRKSKTHRR